MTICLYSLTCAADNVSAANTRESALIGVDGLCKNWLGLDSENTGRFGWGWYINVSLCIQNVGLSCTSGLTNHSDSAVYIPNICQ